MKSLSSVYAIRSILLLIIISLIVLSACGRPDSDLAVSLQRAETLMDEHPDSALEILDGIDAASISSEEQIARYGLLHTQALDKNYIDITDDSLISIAVEYYEKNHDDTYLMKSLYYRGRALYDMVNFDDAIVPALEAYKKAEQSGDHYWIAKTSQLIASIYYMSYNNSNSYKFWKKTISEFRKAGKEREEAFAILQSVGSLHELGKSEYAYTLIDSVGRSFHHLMSDKFFSYSYYSNLLTALSILERNDEAMLVADSILDNRFDGLRTASDYSMLTHIFMDDREKAEDFIEKGSGLVREEIDKINILYARFRLYYRYGSEDELKCSVDSLLKAAEEGASFNLNQSVAAMESAYNRSLKEKSDETANLRKKLNITLVILILFICYFFVTILRRKSIRYSRNINRLEGKLTDSRKELELRKRELSSKKQELVSMRRQLDTYTNEIDTLNEKLKEYSVSNKKLKEDIDRLNEYIDVAESTNIGLKHEVERIIEVSKNLKQELTKNFDIIRNEIENIAVQNYKMCKKGEQNRICLYLLKDFVDNKIGGNIFSTINGYVNLLYDNIIDIIVEDRNVNYTKTEIKIISLLLAGFSRNAVSLILDMKSATVYTHKNRISKKIISQENSPLSEFQALFSNKDYFIKKTDRNDSQEA